MSFLNRPRDHSVHHPSQTSAPRRRRHRPVLKALEDRLAPAGVVNGDFAVSNPADPNYGWTTRGNASIANGEGLLDEGTTVQTEFSQTFTIPTGTTTLGFTIVTANLVSNGAANPPDAFEAACSIRRRCSHWWGRRPASPIPTRSSISSRPARSTRPPGHRPRGRNLGVGRRDELPGVGLGRRVERAGQYPGDPVL